MAGGGDDAQGLLSAPPYGYHRPAITATRSSAVHHLRLRWVHGSHHPPPRATHRPTTLPSHHSVTARPRLQPRSRSKYALRPLTNQPRPSLATSDLVLHDRPIDHPDGAFHQAAGAGGRGCGGQGGGQSGGQSGGQGGGQGGGAKVSKFCSWSPFLYRVTLLGLRGVLVHNLDAADLAAVVDEYHARNVSSLGSGTVTLLYVPLGEWYPPLYSRAWTWTRSQRTHAAVDTYRRVRPEPS